MLVCALGDLLLDVVVRLERPIQEGTDSYGHTRVCPGGQAGNVATWAAELGARSRLVAARSCDTGGRVLAEEIHERGVDLRGPVAAEGTGAIVSIAYPDGMRSMLSDRGISPELRPEDLDPAWFAVDELYVSGYALLGAPMRDAALAASSHARAAGARVSLDISSVGAARTFGVDAFVLACEKLAAATVFATEEERELVAALEPDTWVVKRGERGIVLETGGRREEHPALPAEVVDTTGAGDALAAGYLVGGPPVALAAASRCVAMLGAVP